MNGLNLKKVRKTISAIVSTTLFIMLIVMTLLVISTRASGGEPELFGYQLKTVLSGSMDPTFKTGSIILVEKVTENNSLGKGEVITFKQDDQNVITHRIIEVIQQGETVLYRTKGDNNENVDTNPVMAENVEAKYSGVTIPYVGYFFNYASTSLGTALLLIIPGLLLIGYATWTILQGIKEVEAKTKKSVGQDSKSLS